MGYDDFIENFDEVLINREAPTRSMSVFLQFLLFKFIKNNSKSKVILSGEGADEIFTGYTKHNFIYMASLLLRLKLVKLIYEINSVRKNKGIKVYKILFNILMYLTTEIFGDYRFSIKKGFKFNLTNRFNPNFSFNLLKSHLRTGIEKSALQEYLIDSDKNSMRFSIEVRVPLWITG